MDASTFQLSMPPLYTWNNNKLTLPIVNTKVNTNCRYHVLNTISSVGHTLTPYFIAGKTKFTEITGIERPTVFQSAFSQ